MNAGEDRSVKPLPGSPEYQEHVEMQGQDAMDRAMAMPLVRVFFGLLFACVAIGFISMLVDHISERRWWTLCFEIPLDLLMGVPILIEMGSVCVFGKSRTAWFRALMRRWRTKS